MMTLRWHWRDRWRGLRHGDGYCKRWRSRAGCVTTWTFGVSRYFWAQLGPLEIRRYEQ